MARPRSSRSLLLASQRESQSMQYRRTNANDTYVQRPHVYYAHAVERARFHTYITRTLATSTSVATFFAFDMPSVSTRLLTAISKYKLARAARLTPEAQPQTHSNAHVITHHLRVSYQRVRGYVLHIRYVPYSVSTRIETQYLKCAQMHSYSVPKRIHRMHKLLKRTYLVHSRHRPVSPHSL